MRRVRLTRDRIVVALDTMVKVFSFTRPPQQTAVYETGNNPNGLLALSPTYQNVVLAYPARDNGKISILDLASSDNEPKEIKAHNVRLTQINILCKSNLFSGFTCLHCYKLRRKITSDSFRQRDTH